MYGAATGTTAADEHCRWERGETLTDSRVQTLNDTVRQLEVPGLGRQAGRQAGRQSKVAVYSLELYEQARKERRPVTINGNGVGESASDLR